MLRGNYFDGQTSRAQMVEVQVGEGQLKLFVAKDTTGDEPTAAPSLLRAASLNELRVSERLRHAPRFITFSDGAQIEISDTVGLQQLLADTGFQESPVTRWQQSWKATALAVCITTAVIVASYHWLLPWMSELIAAQIPNEWNKPISTQTVAFLDEKFMEPSALALERQQALSERFATLMQDEANLPPLQLLYRKSPKIGPNAFALPDGTIVVTDELIALAAHDNEILAVLAHEAGHVHERHGLRLAIQSSFVAFVIGWYLGDVSTVLTGVSAALLESRYSREFEFAADEYGAQVLLRHQRSPMLLASMLEKLEQAAEQKNKPADKTKNENENKPTDDSASQIGEYFSSHPETTARIARLRELSEK